MMDPFDFTGPGRAWRIALLVAIVIVLCLDLFVWRPL
jgi:hypothetical protein